MESGTTDSSFHLSPAMLYIFIQFVSIKEFCFVKGKPKSKYQQTRC